MIGGKHVGVKDIQIDEDGNLRCASCGGKNFHGRRTTRAHAVGFVTLGAGALLSKKKLRCQQCSTYNQTGNAQPYERPDEGPVSKYNWPGPVSKKNGEQTDPSDKVARLKDLTELRDAGAINEAEFAALKAEILST